jgi:hypothetical protein
VPGVALGTGKAHGAAGIHHTSWWRCRYLAAHTAHAQQQTRVRRLIVLMGAAETTSSRGWLATFLHRLDELGWHEGSNLFTKLQWWNDRPEQMRAWAAELIAGSPDVAVTFSNLALELMQPLAGRV